jgi:Fe-S cluster biogenesis protein NfuA
MANVRERIEGMFEQVLRPLLAVDDGGVEIVSCEGSRATVRLTGSFAGCPSRPVVEQRVVRPAIQRVAGRGFEVRFAPPRPHPLSERPPAARARGAGG